MAASLLDMPADRRRAGFTLLELLIVACVISIMAAILLNRVQFYQRMAEKAAVEQTVSVLQSVLQLRFASLIASNRLGEVDGLVEQNPMEWLAQKPVNYAGEYFDQIPDEDISGKWYFDLKTRALVYFVHNHAALNNENEVLPQLRFKANLVLAVKNFPVAERPISGKVVEGVVLEQIVPYAWN